MWVKKTTKKTLPLRKLVKLLLLISIEKYEQRSPEGIFSSIDKIKKYIVNKIYHCSDKNFYFEEFTNSDDPSSMELYIYPYINKKWEDLTKEEIQSEYYDHYIIEEWNLDDE